MILGVALIVICPVSEAYTSSVPFTKENIIRGIVGEAEDQGYEGMLAVAEAIRNRGTLHGVYGIKSERLTDVEPWVWDQAARAYLASQTSNTVLGADHWHNTAREGENYWTRRYELMVVIGDHHFYKSND